MITMAQIVELLSGLSFKCTKIPVNLNLKSGELMVDKHSIASTDLKSD